MNARSWGWPATITLSCAAVVLLTATGPSPVRTLATVWFLLICPGMALVRLLRLGDPWAELAAGSALSISLGIAVAAVPTYAGAWSPATSLAILVDVSLLGAVLQLAPGRRVRLALWLSQAVVAAWGVARMAAPAFDRIAAPSPLAGAGICLVVALVGVLIPYQMRLARDPRGVERRHTVGIVVVLLAAFLVVSTVRLWQLAA